MSMGWWVCQQRIRASKGGRSTHAQTQYAPKVLSTGLECIVPIQQPIRIKSHTHTHTHIYSPHITVLLFQSGTFLHLGLLLECFTVLIVLILAGLLPEVIYQAATFVA